MKEIQEYSQIWTTQFLRIQPVAFTLRKAKLTSTTLTMGRGIVESDWIDVITHHPVDLLLKGSIENIMFIRWGRSITSDVA